MQRQQELQASTGVVDCHGCHHSKQQRRGSVLDPLFSRPPGAAGWFSSNGQDIRLPAVARLSAKVRPPEKLLPRWWELRTDTVSRRAAGQAGHRPWCVRQ